MTSATATELNALFKQIYNLTEQVLLELENPPSFKHTNHLCKLEEGVSKYMKLIQTQPAWDNPEENRGHFEAGYHDSIRVFYPFADDQQIFDKVELERYRKHLFDYLKCICMYSKHHSGDAASLALDVNNLFK